MFKEFKEFAIKGNAMDLAIGIIIGAAFTSIVNSLVNDILLPFSSLFTGKIDFGALKITLFNSVLIRYGSFINAVISFLIVSFTVFILVRQINRFKKSPPASTNTKECVYCKSLIPRAASRCPHCTSDLTGNR